MPVRRSFYEVLSAAIRDIDQNGFDTPHRIEYWTIRLRDAAALSMLPYDRMVGALRIGLYAIYKRLVEKGGVAKYHPGIERFTLAKVAPLLRAELDRRIVSSANLIKINREEVIARTLRRFQGWATSVPADGGTDKREASESIKKSLARLPFEERRVLIDQGHKLSASINEIVAIGGGALALIWHSHWRQAGYNYREDHKERDEQVYALRDSWAYQQGLMKPGPAGWYNNVTAVGEEINCRCYAEFIYRLRDLPDEMLTAKGREGLTVVRGLVQ